jgi:hypothetical protein
LHSRAERRAANELTIGRNCPCKRPAVLKSQRWTLASHKSPAITRKCLCARAAGCLAQTWNSVGGIACAASPTSATGIAAGYEAESITTDGG